MSEKPWVFVAEDEENWPCITRTPELWKEQPGDILFDHEDAPTTEQGELFADALNVHETTGLTPSQLQARVAELEAAQTKENAVEKISSRHAVSGD